MDDPVVKRPLVGTAAAPSALDPTQYHGPRGMLPPSSGQPRSAQEVRDGLRRAKEAEQRGADRDQARMVLVELGAELSAARRMGQADLAAELETRRETLLREINANYK